MSNDAPLNLPDVGSGSSLSPEQKRDIAMANLFEAATRVIFKLEPMIGLAIAQSIAAEKENRR